MPCFAAPDRPHATRSPLFCALNRHYVTPRLAELATRLARAVAAGHPSVTLYWLDVGFPFGDGFPLLPHVSHDDGGKIDIAVIHAAPSGRSPSPIGCWGFVQPRPGDLQPCAGRSDWLTLRWDMAWLQPVLPNFPLDVPAMRGMLSWLVTEGPAWPGPNSARTAHPGPARGFVVPHPVPGMPRRAS